MSGKKVLQSVQAGIIIETVLNYFHLCVTEDFIMAATVITKDMLIGDILDLDRTTAPFFMEMGMHCLGCPASRGESLEQACMVHGVDVNEMVEKLNEHVTSKA
jgi:hybrid cluster-associated redox disulfide protein